MFRASVLTWLAAAPCLVHQLNKASPPAGGDVWYLLYVVLHPGTIDWWPHQQLLSTSHEQFKVPTQILDGRASNPRGLTVDLKLLKVDCAFSLPLGPFKVQQRNSTQGPEDGISQFSSALVSPPRFPMISAGYNPCLRWQLGP